MDRGGGRVVNSFASDSDDTNSNHAEDDNFSVKLCLKNQNKQKETRVGLFKKTTDSRRIQTWIIRVECKQADHLTITTISNYKLNC